MQVCCPLSQQDPGPGAAGETLQPGHVLEGRYRLGRVLGRGGMAEVVDGFDLRLERSVAVKLMLSGVAANDTSRARFEAEARAAARLSHPNVVAIHDTGESDGRPWIVMERLPGLTLANVLDSNGPLAFQDVLRLAGDVLGALGAAHDAGVVHRDVKPSNILLSAQGVAKVGDFGIAKALDGLASTATTTSVVLGTPAYVAPERLAGSPARQPSDLWSLGVVLYECLVGERPFPDGYLAAAYLAPSRRIPKPLALACPGIPKEMAYAIETALALDPQERFASAAEMALAMGAPIRVADPPRRPTMEWDHTRVSVVPPVQNGTREALTPSSELTTRSLHVTPGPFARRARWALVIAVVAIGVIALALSLAERPRPSSEPPPASLSTTSIAHAGMGNVGHLTTAELQQQAGPAV